MTSSNHMLFALATLFTLATLGWCRPSSFNTDDLSSYLENPPSKRFFFPVEVSSDAILGALRAHAQSLRDSESDIYEQKRTTAQADEPNPYLSRMDLDSKISGIKRKMFWQPLGYIPASVRVHNSAVGAAESNSKGSSSNVFRYG